MFWISSEPSARGEELHYDLGAVRPFETRASPIRRVVNGRLRHNGQGAVRRAQRCVVSRVGFSVSQTSRVGLARRAP